MSKHIPPDFKLIWKRNSPVFVSLLLLILLYLLLRITNLLILPIFADEAIYIRWAQVMQSEPTLRFVSMQDGKQPLFMWLMIPLFKVFSDPLFAGRLLSVISGLGSMIGMFFLSNELFKSQRLSLTTAFLYAVVPFALFFDRMALVDSMLLMWSVWGVFFLSKMVKNPTFGWSVLSGVCFGFAWLTKSPAMFFFGLMPFSVLLIDLPKPPAKRSKYYNKWFTPARWYLIKIFLNMGLIFIGSMGIYNILRLGPEFHQIALRNADYIYPLSEVIANPFFEFIYKFKTIWGFYWIFLTPFVWLMSLIGFIFLFIRRFKLSLFLFVWFSVPIVYQFFFARSLTARYYLYTLPPLLMLAAWTWQTLFDISKLYIWRIFIALVVLLPLLWKDVNILRNPASVNLPRIERSGYLEEWTAGFGLRDIASYINREAMVESVVVGTEGFFGTMPDGLQIYFDKHPRVTIIGTDPDVRQISDQLYNSLKSNKVYFLVNKSRLKIENPESVGLMLIKEFPKAIRPDGSRESLLFFEVVNDPR